MGKPLANPMSLDELLALPPVVSVPVAGRAWGIGRDKALQLVRDGGFPCTVLKVGSENKVRRVDLLRSLGYNPDGSAADDGAEVAS